MSEYDITVPGRISDLPPGWAPDWFWNVPPFYMFFFLFFYLLLFVILACDVCDGRLTDGFFHVRGACFGGGLSSDEIASHRIEQNTVFGIGPWPRRRNYKILFPSLGANLFFILFKKKCIRIESKRVEFTACWSLLSSSVLLCRSVYDRRRKWVNLVVKR